MIRKHFIFSAAALLSGLLLLPAQAANLPESGICAHRGNNAHFPENTLPAFKSAIELGAAQIELDVCCSKDKKLVIMHDLNVRRTTSGEGDIRHLSGGPGHYAAEYLDQHSPERKPAGSSAGNWKNFRKGREAGTGFLPLRT